MCNIWQKYEKDPQAHQKEIRSDQFFASALFLLSHGKNFTITTNGVLSSKITDFVTKLSTFPQQYGISISLDAIGAIHDKIRGRKKFYEKAMQTLKKLIQAKENGSNIRLLSFQFYGIQRFLL